MNDLNSLYFAKVRCPHPETCGEIHDHCVDCGVRVLIDDRKRCTLGCGLDARCQDCAADHYETYHKYAEENRPSWETWP